MRAALYDMCARMGKLLTREPWPLHRDEDIEPLFIVGSGRSGTTLLRRMLVASGELHIPPETYVLAQVIEHYRRNAYEDWGTLVRDCMALFEMHPEFDCFQITLRPLLLKLKFLPEEQRSLAVMLDMFYRYHAEQVGNKAAARWGDKTPINTFALDAIVEVFPKAKFIHLLRDGVDVVYSYISSGLIADLDLALARWRDSVLLADDFVQQHDYSSIEVRYERLSCHPENEIQRVCVFLGLDFSPDIAHQRQHISKMGDMHKYGHYQHANEKITTKHMGKGRKSLSEEEMKRLQKLIGGTLTKMGYPVW